MLAALDVVLPVFILIGAGYVAAWRGWFSDSGLDGLMTFAQRFAIPSLLFSGVSQIDLAASFNPALLASFYTGAFTGFALGLFGARYVFGRAWPDAVAIGFIGLFSNSVLLGLPITQRAYGSDALAANFAIISIHAATCYVLGITMMEIVRSPSRAIAPLVGRVGRTVFHNALIIGILAGFAVNLTGLTLPSVLNGAVDMLVRTAIPVALFGLGGILFRYKPEGDAGTIAFVLTASLLIHPAITYGLGTGLGLSQAELRSAVLTAAMAPGVNVYIFADLYGVGRRVAASSVLIGTALCVVTTGLWLTILA